MPNHAGGGAIAGNLNIDGFLGSFRLDPNWQQVRRYSECSECLMVHHFKQRLFPWADLADRLTILLRTVCILPSFPHKSSWGEYGLMRDGRPV
jgi:hypothetical protein